MNPSPQFPFAAIVGQDRMKQALIVNIIDPSIGGVLIRGEKGTAKSTAVRGLAEILPVMEAVENCPFQLPSPDEDLLCGRCMDHRCLGAAIERAAPTVVKRKIKVVELPVGATEDRLIGTLSLEHALKKGEKKFEPGMLAHAHRGILYVDEVNLLEDHLVDVLLDSAAMGVNTVEREGVSFVHPARFTLVGTMNPEEGELRPQLLDRFGLCVTIEGVREVVSRVEIVERRLKFDDDPGRFVAEWAGAGEALAQRIIDAKALRRNVTAPRAILEMIAAACARLRIDGHRGDIVTLKTAKALAAYEGRTAVLSEDVSAAAALALPHRVRRTPFDELTADINAEIAKALDVRPVSGA
jgi:magnesium chelatase subunit I